MGVRDPRPDIMGDDVDSSCGREVGRFEETMQVACGSIEIVTPGRLVALTETSRVEYDDAAACADQQRQHLSPGDPALGPPRKQQYRIAGPGRHVVEARAVDLRDMVFDLRALGEGARGEQGAGRHRGKRLDEHGHCILSFGSPWRPTLPGPLSFVAGLSSGVTAAQDAAPLRAALDALAIIEAGEARPAVTSVGARYSA